MCPENDKLTAVLNKSMDECYIPLRIQRVLDKGRKYWGGPERPYRITIRHLNNAPDHMLLRTPNFARVSLDEVREVIAREVGEEGEREPSRDEGGITRQEKLVVDLLAEAWNAFCLLPTEHPNDNVEMCRIIHAGQEKVLSRLGRRLLRSEGLGRAS